MKHDYFDCFHFGCCRNAEKSCHCQRTNFENGVHDTWWQGKVILIGRVSGTSSKSWKPLAKKSNSHMGERESERKSERDGSIYINIERI